LKKIPSPGLISLSCMFCFWIVFITRGIERADLEASFIEHVAGNSASEGQTSVGRLRTSTHERMP
jgi:hypothetical protein